MKPRTPDPAAQDDLSRRRLDNIIAVKQPLARMPGGIDWKGMNKLFGDYCEDAVLMAAEAHAPHGTPGKRCSMRYPSTVENADQGRAGQGVNNGR